MAILFIILCVGIAYGTLYPFDFRPSLLDAHSLRAFVATWGSVASKGDLLANVILFVPFGFLGVIAGAQRFPVRRTIAGVVLLGIGFSFVLQLAQILLPSRIASLDDVIWNTTGQVAGVLVGLAAWRRDIATPGGRRIEIAAPAALLGCWVAYRLFPFVPSLDFGSVKDSLKPLLLHPEIATLAVLTNAVSWLVAGYLLRRVWRPGRGMFDLAALMAMVMLLEVLIIDNQVSLSNVIGAAIALGLSAFPMFHGRAAPLLLAGLVTVAVVVSGLDPYVLRDDPVSFNWMPFHGWLGGSMYHNALVLIWKVYLYGSLVYLWRCAGAPWPSAMLWTAIPLGLIEAAQTVLGSHTPEITDPLLAVLLTVGLMLIDRLGNGRAAAGPKHAT